MILDLQYEAHGNTVCATIGHVEAGRDPNGAVFPRYVVDGPEPARRLIQISDLPPDLIADLRSVLDRIELRVLERMAPR